MQTGYNQQERAFHVLLSPQGPSAHLIPNPLLHLVVSDKIRKQFLTQSWCHYTSLCAAWPVMDKGIIESDNEENLF